MDRAVALEAFRRVTAVHRIRPAGPHVIAAAVDLLLADVDLHPVTVLAGADHAEERELDELIARATAALGLTPASDGEAARFAIEEVAHEYAAGRRPRDAAAREIWTIFAGGFPEEVADLGYAADAVDCMPGAESDAAFDAAVAALMTGGS